ncbi:MAG: hypothetical protein U0903_13455 [Planctomycetales bacterium]
MDFILHGYYVNELTWFYLSFLLIVSVFFRFNRLWSLRNLDLALLLSLAPALLYAEQRGAKGSVWILVVTGLLLVRVLGDSWFTRRPRLPQNMNAAGLTFLCCSAIAFLTTKVITEPPPTSTVNEMRRVLSPSSPPEEVAANTKTEKSAEAAVGPGSRLIYAAVAPGSRVAAEAAAGGATDERLSEQVAAQTMAILAHLAVVSGLIMLGSRHFGDIQLGLAMATLYLLLPCTAYEVGKVNHVLPAALIVWAVVSYRHPRVAGVLLGLACGTLIFPLFLLPIWISFYPRRQCIRFLQAVGIVAALLLGSYAFTSADWNSFTQQVFGQMDWTIFAVHDREAEGFWSVYPGAYRITVFVAFVILITVLTIWPRNKDLAHLISASTATVMATQFWYPVQGGVYVLWYLPLLLMVVFRPWLNHHLPPDAVRTETEPVPSAVPAPLTLAFSVGQRQFLRR